MTINRYGKQKEFIKCKISYFLDCFYD